MPSEVGQSVNHTEILEEIVKRFQPIELLFDVMGVADTGVQGIFVRRWAQIGMQLAENFLVFLDQIVIAHRNETDE